MATVEQLDYELNFKWDKKTFSKFNESLKKSVAGFAKLGAAIVVAQGAAFGIAKNIADQNDELAKLAPRLNTTTEEYQKLEFAAKRYGASGEDVASSLKNLTKAQEDVMRGKGDIEAFGRLGINPADFQNSSDLLIAVSDSVKDIQSSSEKINLLERIGVSTNLLQALESGSANIDSLGNKFESFGAVVSKEQIKVAGEFQDAWLDSMTIVGSVANSVGSNLLKNINKFLSKFIKFAQDNMKGIIDGFNKLFRVVNKASQILFAVLNRIFTMIQKLVNMFGGWEKAVMVLAGAFAFLKRRMIGAFIIPIALATGLFLIIEDMFSALEGKDSVFKDIFGNTGVEALAGFVDLIALSIKGWGMLINNWRDALDGLLIILENIANKFKELVSFDLPSFGDIGNSINSFFGSSQPTQTITNNGGARNSNVTMNISGASGSVVDEINQFFQQTSNRIFGE